MSEPAPQVALLPAALLALAALAIVDLVVVFGVATPARLAEPTPLDDGPTLVARLGALRRHPGPTVALLGDSVIYGRALEEHGAGDWRQDNLAPALQTSLGQDTLAVNLGMNGALLADQAWLMPHVLAAKPDLVVLDVSLRSFSADFAVQGEQVSRPWLQELAIGATFAEGWRGQGWGERLTRTLTAGAARTWGLYRYRAWMQARFLSGVPRDAVTRRRDAGIARSEGAPPADEDAALDAELALMLRTKARYATVDVGGHPQESALRDILAALKQAKQPAVLFYATENPSLLPSLVDPAEYAADLAVLEAFIRERLGAEQVWMGPNSSADPATYLDHVHRTAPGLAALARRIAALAPGMEGADGSH